MTQRTRTITVKGRVEEAWSGCYIKLGPVNTRRVRRFLKEFGVSHTVTARLTGTVKRNPPSVEDMQRMFSR